jgi:hypothetical protein
MGDPQTTRKPTHMKAHSLNHATLSDSWLNPPDDEPDWCDNCSVPLERCGCDDDNNEVT